MELVVVYRALYALQSTSPVIALFCGREQVLTFILVDNEASISSVSGATPFVVYIDFIADGEGKGTEMIFNYRIP